MSGKKDIIVKDAWIDNQTTTANQGKVYSIPYTIPSGYSYLALVDILILNQAGAASLQGVTNNTISIFVWSFNSGSNAKYGIKYLCKAN